VANGSSFRAVRTRVKRTPVHAWIYLPAEPLPQGLARRAACSPGEVGQRIRIVQHTLEKDYRIRCRLQSTGTAAPNASAYISAVPLT
jgi:hypothetical protein